MGGDVLEVVSGAGHPRWLVGDTRGTGLPAVRLASVAMTSWLLEPGRRAKAVTIRRPMRTSERQTRAGPGSRVLVTGAGPIGLVCLQAAKAFGATYVAITDVNPRRLAFARELGASEVVNVGETSLADAVIEPDVLLECSGNPAATGAAIRAVRRAGRVVLVGMGGDEIPGPLAHVQTRELEVTGTFRYANTWPDAIALAASGRVDLDALVTGHYGLADVEQALTAGARDPDSVKAVVTPQR